MGIHYDYKSTRGAKAMEKQAKREKKLAEKRAKKQAKAQEKGLVEKVKKMNIIQIRATPIMEILTGFIIAGFIYYSGYLVMEGKIGINNFFSFLTNSSVWLFR